MSLEAKELASGVLAGNVRKISKAITAIENHSPISFELLKELFPHTGKAHVVGITGPPGAGKSTLTDRMISRFRDQGKTVGVIAVDPTSPYTGGAILGDRVRMSGHYNDPGVYIRSMATRGALGGVSYGTYDAVTVLEAAGMDVVIIETVGVGQDEIDIVHTAHTSAVVLIPGMGDEIQAIKAGILEIGDIFIINKSDKDGSARLMTELNMMLDLAEDYQTEGWRPPIIKTIAANGTGVDDVVNAFSAHHDVMKNEEAGQKRELQRSRHRIKELWKEVAMEKLFKKLLPEGDFQKAAQEISERKAEPFSLVERMLGKLTIEGLDKDGK